ncbi:putative acid-sensing ion channel 2-like 2, partial [Homarus americanus]
MIGGDSNTSAINSKRKSMLSVVCGEDPGLSVLQGLGVSLNLDENPPAYDTMYPGLMPHSTELLTLGVNQPTELSRDNVFRCTELSRDTVIQSTELNPWVTLNKATTEKYPNDLENKDTTKQEGRDQERNENRDEKTKKLEGKMNLSKISKGTRERLIVQATDLSLSARAALRDFCSNTTAHGFNHVTQEDLHVLLRLFWLVVTLVSLGILLSVTYQVTYAAFVSKRPHTEVTYRDQSRDGLPLPDMTICSLSRFWKSKLKEHGVGTSLASYLLVAVGGPEVISHTLRTDPRRIRMLRDDLNTYLKENNLTLSQMITMLSP